MTKYLILSFLVFSFASSAQKIHGIVFSEKGDLLPYSSITIKGTTIGSSANNRAKFGLNLSAGAYTVVCQHIGYATQEKKIMLGNTDEEMIFILKEQKLEMKEIIVKAGAEDPAYEIIRQAIKKRPLYKEEVKSFTCDLYSKDMIKLRRLPKRIMGKKVPEEDRQEMGLDTSGAGIIYLSESIASVAALQPDKFKLEVKSSRVSGSSSFGFTFPTFISLYHNNVIIFTQRLNPRGFISPIADGAIYYYKYKFLGSFWEDGKEINSIRVIPRRSYEPLFSGVINITDGNWRIHSLDLFLTKKSQLEILDTLKITQFHVPVDKETWRVKNQLLHFNFSQFGIDATGNFVNVYSNYKINPIFKKNYFDNVVIKYDTGVTNKTKVYWDTIRPVPLEKEERLDYQVKDSLYEVNKDKEFTKKDIDSLKKKQGPIKPLGIFWSGINRTRYSKTNQFNWGLDALIKNLEYNTAEGIVLNASGYYKKFLKNSKTNLTVRPNLRYGFSNNHLNGWVDVNLQTRDLQSDGKLRRNTWNFSGGSRVTQFNKESPIMPLVNSFSTLLYGENYLKNYENVFGNVSFSKRFENGLRLSVNALYEDRIPLENTSSFTFFKKDSSSLTPNYPFEKITTQFSRHKAFLLSLDLSFKPGQKYIQFPDSKMAVGSNYPTFSVNYTKGINGLLGSDVNFDKWKFTITDDVNFRIAGSLKYKIGIGGFINTRSVFIQDYQHFNGNLTIVASDYVNSFQMASYYANSTFANFYAMAHLEHHLNGLFTNKIPLFKRLNWNLVVGTNTFYINQNSNHVEVFAGLENIFKIFRVDFIAAYINGNIPVTGIRIGFGGLLGSNMQSSGRGSGISLSF